MNLQSLPAEVAAQRSENDRPSDLTRSVRLLEAVLCYPWGMTLQPDDVRRLDERAREVGKKIGWPLSFVVLPNPEYVGLVAGPDRAVVIGPGKLSDLAAHDIELDLDALERDRKIARDEDGDPRFI